MLSANQISELLKQPYLKKYEVNQPDILHVDRDSVNRDLKKIFKVWS